MKNTQKDSPKQITGTLTRPKKWKLILSAIALLFVVIAIAIGAGMRNTIRKQDAQITELKEQIEQLEAEPIIVNAVNPEIILQTTNEEIKSIGELATMEYLYTNAAKFSDSREIKGVKIPFTEKSFILRWNGVIKAGVNVDEITTRIDDTAKILYISMPAAELLSHEVDYESVEVLDEKNNLFNTIKVEDKVDFDTQVSQEMERQAVKNDLLENAQENAEEIITRLLNANPDIRENYRLEFEWQQA